jgi:xanthine dehydrogenase accessory factor
VSGTLYDELRRSLELGEPVLLAEVTRVSESARATTPLASKLLVRDDGSVLGTLFDPELNRIVAREALAILDLGGSATRHYGRHGEARQDEVEIFFESFVVPAHLVIFGAVDFTRALVEIAKVLGYTVTVCDARAVFATVARFPSADEVVVDWPDRYLARVGPCLGARDAICVLTHDAKFDVPAILGALTTKVGYIGAMGSRRTHEQRWRRLIEAGASEPDLSKRLMSPIGLDLGARTPEETAVAICAEMIAVRRGRSGSFASLRDGTGPIH